MSDTLRLTIQRLGRDGDGLARRAGAVWSVPGTVPGDVVEALPAGGSPGRSGAARARLLRVLRPSADRIAPACPAADECGGCDWLHVAPPARLRAKAALVREALGRSEDEPLETLASPTERCRRVARLAVGRDRGGPVLGYRHARAHRIARLRGCPALEPELDAALAALAAAPQALAAWLAAPAGELWLLSDEARRVHLARPSSSGVAGRAARGDRAAAAALESLRAVLPERLRPGARAPSIEAADGGPALRVPAGGFVQANRALAPELARLACAWSGGPPSRVLELYAGSGHLTVALARSAAALVAVESDAAAAAALAENLERRGARHARAICGDAGRAAAEAEPGCVVVADPPRAGLGPAAAALAARRPARIVLVSCDLHALARDARALRDGGYVPRRAALLDFFPATHHAEVATLFEPA